MGCPSRVFCVLSSSFCWVSLVVPDLSFVLSGSGEVEVKGEEGLSGPYWLGRTYLTARLKGPFKGRFSFS